MSAQLKTLKDQLLSFSTDQFCQQYAYAEQKQKLFRTLVYQEVDRMIATIEAQTAKTASLNAAKFETLTSAMTQVAADVSTDLHTFKTDLRTQLAQGLSALSGHIGMELNTAIHSLRPEYDLIKTAVGEAVTADLTVLRTAFAEQANEYTAAKAVMREQLEEMRRTQQMQHEDLVSVRAALQAVCAQFEAFKGKPAARLQHAECLDTKPSKEVKSAQGVVPDSEKSMNRGQQMICKVSIPVVLIQNDLLKCTFDMQMYAVCCIAGCYYVACCL